MISPPDIMVSEWGVRMDVTAFKKLILAEIAALESLSKTSKSGRDPAVGSSVLITAMTDSGGFFIFLGLATLVLI